MDQSFHFFQRLLKDIANIPLSRTANRQPALLDFFETQTDYALNFFFRENSAFLHRLFQPAGQTDTIYEYPAPCGITFLVYADKSADYLLLLGPVLTQPFSQESAAQTLAQYHLPPQIRHRILQLCSELPVVESHILYRAGLLVFGYLTEKKQPLKVVQATVPPPAESSLINPLFSTGDDIVQMRQVETRYEYSAALTDAVRQGNLSLALHLVGRYDPDTQTPVRNTNPLRNAQNYCIVLNTQLRHALEKSGIHPYRVDKLSNEIGLQIEQLKSTTELAGFFKSVIRRYCRLVQEHTYPDLKPLVNLAVTYIKEHLADNITVRDTAKALTVNANYLSSLFHKEMGMTFIDFVNRERTNQAAALLKHTNLQIQQIASIVGYNNTSYFAKEFLRFQGMTPSHFRREGTI